MPDSSTPVPPQSADPDTPPRVHHLDITRQVCPMTWVKTRLALEDCDSGDVLVIRVRAGESHMNVRRNCRDFGHEVLEDVEEPQGTDAPEAEAAGSGVRQLRVRVN